MKPDQADLATSAAHCCSAAADLMLIAFAGERKISPSRAHSGQTACDLARALRIAIRSIEGAGEFRLEELRAQIAEAWKEAADIPIAPILRPSLSVHTGDRPHV